MDTNNKNLHFIAAYDAVGGETRIDIDTVRCLRRIDRRDMDRHGEMPVNTDTPGETRRDSVRHGETRTDTLRHAFIATQALSLIMSEPAFSSSPYTGRILEKKKKRVPPHCPGRSRCSQLAS